MVTMIKIHCVHKSFKELAKYYSKNKLLKEKHDIYSSYSVIIEENMYKTQKSNRVIKENQFHNTHAREDSAKAL